MGKNIVIKGAKENNLKSVDVTIPRDSMVVLTGLSGSGKSSLAFDTIYAEGQRKYMESLSSYARQFLGQMEKPNVESIEGLSPAISIDQKTTNHNPRSTVGTVTEIYDYLRLMYARIGVPHCPVCGKEITSQSVDQIVELLMSEGEGTRLTILAPVIRQRKGQHEKIIDRIMREGFRRARIDGEIVLLDEQEVKLEKTYKHTIEIVVDRIKVREGSESRLSEACELAIAHGEGLVQVIVAKDGGEEEKTFSTSLACPDHGISIDELEPRMFSFNNPLGACPECKGLGFIQKIDPDLLIPDQSLSIPDKALGNAFATMEYTSYYWQVIQALADKYDADVTLPYKDLPEEFKQVLLYGTGDEQLVYDYTNRAGMVQHRKHTFEGIIPNMERRYVETNSEYIKGKMEQYMNVATCSACEGKKLRPELLAVTVGGINIMEFCDLSVSQALEFLDTLPDKLSVTDLKISEEVVKEIKGRLRFLANVGLDYLTLSRAAMTLSGGESQRIRLATQIGSGLVGVSYILDEPSIGLHQKDNEKLLKSLRELTDIGNTLIIVEHDEDTMYAADQIIDIGPGAGVHGGRLVAQGSVEDIKACPESMTGQYLSGKKKIEVPATRREGNG
ncbi:MAG: excinuclease ABC subunit UvrA, partial [Firmicutes bacterium]|nr:excinuclease ABC subunit UvrA [Bacillota bacterium]